MRNVIPNTFQMVIASQKVAVANFGRRWVIASRHVLPFSAKMSVHSGTRRTRMAVSHVSASAENHHIAWKSASMGLSRMNLGVPHVDADHNHVHQCVPSLASLVTSWMRMDVLRVNATQNQTPIVDQYASSFAQMAISQMIKGVQHVNVRNRVMLTHLNHRGGSKQWAMMIAVCTHCHCVQHPEGVVDGYLRVLKALGALNVASRLVDVRNVLEPALNEC